ncbi:MULTISPECIES: restriction endonuclease [Streptomyces]|uniref:restriction endonuclease n=1 Tax=Streptomyces TaxID=1883 RepID=UPI0019B737AA|nr:MULTISPECIES: restriction endonuclease [Streptomyces]GGS12983.1 hypothetical protein GCM10010236_79190 [Streptomyces eurythermus]
MSDTYTVLHDPHGLVDAELPLDRDPYEALVTAVLAWQDPDLTPRDYEQIALQLTGHARAELVVAVVAVSGAGGVEDEPGNLVAELSEVAGLEPGARVRQGPAQGPDGQRVVRAVVEATGDHVVPLQRAAYGLDLVLTGAPGIDGLAHQALDGDAQVS